MIEKSAPAPSTPSDVPDAVKPVLAAAREYFTHLRGGALLIGVEDYSRFDPTGRKDLPAGRNDVLAWWKVCRRLGYTHLRVLASPALTEDDLVRAELELVPELSPGETPDQVRARVRRWLSVKEPPRPSLAAETAEEVAERVAQWLASVRRAPDDLNVFLREATSSELKEAARWLAGGLVTNVALSWGAFQLHEEWESLPGIMTYSGHGARRDGDLVLCPSDTGPALDGSLSFSELRAIFDEADALPGGRHPTDNLTIVLDCCFAAAGDRPGAAQRATGLTPAVAAPFAPAPRKEIGSRVFCASARDETSYQAMLGGHWHGAFTWALTVALEQWKIKEEGQFRHSTMSHAELLFRSRMLLQALSFHQHPILVDELGNLPVFHHGTQDGDRTSARPDAKRPGIQLDPSGEFPWTEFTLKDANGDAVARAIVSRGSQGNWDGNKEYWYVYRAFDTSSGDWTLQVDGVQAPSASPDNALKFDRGTTWSPTQRAPDVIHTWPVSPTNTTFNFGLTAAATSSNGKYALSVTWWCHSQQNLNFTGSPQSSRYPLVPAHAIFGYSAPTNTG